MTCRWRWVRLLFVTTAVSAVLVALAPAKQASGHAFLIRTAPAQGERLDSAPDDVSLEFSETFDPETARLKLTVDGEEQALTPQVGAEGRVLRSDIATDRDGVYVVSWDVTASDGHETAGEFAFGVRTAVDGVPADEAVSPPPEPLRVVAGGVFFAGLALAVGNLAAHWAGASLFRGGVMGLGLVLAEIGALVAWIDAQVSDEPARQQLSLAATALALAVALQLFRLSRSRWPAAIAVAVAVAAASWSARGHGAVINGLLGGVIDVVHLVAGAAWLGALVLLVMDLRREHHGVGVLTVGRRYARLAAGLVIVLAIAGIASAALLLETPSDLWTTSYGQALAVKTGLVAIALALATLGRRALEGRATGTLRRTTPFEAAALVGVLAVTALLVNLAPPGAASVSGVSLLGPPPIRGAVARDGGLAGQLTVAVTANTRQLRVEVFAPSGGRPASDAEVELEAELPNGDRTTLVPRPCGPGCFTQRIALPEGSTRLNIAATDPEWASGLHVAQLDMPPLPNQPELLTELTTTMQSVPAVGFTETTTSGPGATSSADTFELAGSRFVELEPWAAGTADDIQPLGGERGFRMYIPGDRIWITVWQDDQGRVAHERIVSLSHEIVREDFYYPAP